jgi:hypothetical protein
VASVTVAVTGICEAPSAATVLPAGVSAMLLANSSGIGAMLTTGWLRCVPPMEPLKLASPWVNMPPSVATIQ